MYIPNPFSILDMRNALIVINFQYIFRTFVHYQNLSFLSSEISLCDAFDVVPIITKRHTRFLVHLHALPIDKRTRRSNERTFERRQC